MQFTVCVLHVPNIDEALTFYRDTMGLPVMYMDPFGNRVELATPLP